MKAIHNGKWICTDTGCTVLNTSKIQKWKQFTTFALAGLSSFILSSIRQRYKNESNSQLCQLTVVTITNCPQYVKDTKMKAIHNTPTLTNFLGCTVLNTSKIQKWKQFTTIGITFRHFDLLSSIRQRYKNESNSQPIASLIVWDSNCPQYVKDTKMKAIHNYINQSLLVFLTVIVTVWLANKRKCIC